MIKYLYYCKNCNVIEDDIAEDAKIRCPECWEYLYPLYITEDEWESFSNSGKRQVIQDALIPKRRNSSRMNMQRTSYLDDCENEYEDEKYYGNHEQSFYRKTSTMSVISFVLSLTCIFSAFGLILGIVDLTKKDGRRKGLSIAATAIGAVVTPVAITILYSMLMLLSKVSI